MIVVDPAVSFYMTTDWTSPKGGSYLYNGFYINWTSVPTFSTFFTLSDPIPIPKDLHCPICYLSYFYCLFPNPCNHSESARPDGVPAVPYVELLK